MKIEMGCSEGKVRFYESIGGDVTNTLNAGQHVQLSLGGGAMIQPAITHEERELGTVAKLNITHAQAAPGLGVDRRNLGTCYVKALEGDVKVREYLETNAFLEPDKPDHKDHVVAEGRTLYAVAINSNRQTLVVMGAG